MVQKKTNLHTVNSGNTMRKRYYQQKLHKRVSSLTHVIKCLEHVPQRTPDKKEQQEIIEAAKAYIDDGCLASCVQNGTRWFRTYTDIYTLNKKKRWLLKDVVEDAVSEDSLAEEAFKVSLVHRVVPCDDHVSTQNRTCNVIHYFDSRSSARTVAANSNSTATKFGLMHKANKDSDNLDSKNLRQLKRRRNHNQHFRGVQRKKIKASTSSEETRTAEQTPVPEIKYEIAEAMKLNSAILGQRSLRYKYSYWNCQRTGTHFRGPKKDLVNWYYTDFTNCTASVCQETVFLAAEVGDSDIHLYEEDDEAESHWTARPTEQEYSLFDLVVATKNKLRQKPSKPATIETGSRVNSASGQVVKKYGKGTAIVLEKKEEEDDAASVEDLELTRDSVSEAGMTDDSGLQLSDESSDTSIEVVSGPTVDYEEEISMSDKSFCTCGIPESELKVHYLQDMVGEAVEFGRCAPFTARFNMHAVSMAVINEQEGSLEEWWLLCQTADMTMMDSTGTTLEKQVMVKLKLYSGQKEEDVSAANVELQQLVKDKETGQPVFMCLYTLLVSVSHILSNRWTKKVVKVDKLESDRKYGLSNIHLPYEAYTEQVEVCDVREAFHHLQPNQQGTSQHADDEDLAVSSSMTWVDEECQVCFTCFDESRTSYDGFSSSVAIITCGHSFCRRCWQHHLMASVLEGQTTVLCMEYKCKTAVDATTLMSLVPQWVYTRWQQRLHSRMVERSGQWTWCPNARCGLLAKKVVADKEEKMRKRQGCGVPVECLCQKQWCLDCGRDAHWPVTCTQFDTYTKLLKQNGDEDGLKTTYVEITSVQVKRCPLCRYPMEKNGGCSHMVCAMCSTSFCWVCLAAWNEHAFGNWTGCIEKTMETVELNNDVLYPLPIEYYRKAVSYRYVWKELDRMQHKTSVAYHAYYSFIKETKAKLAGTLPVQAVDHVMDAFIFLKQANTLLELSFILLSNTPRKHQLAKPLRQDLQLLEFCSSRVSQYLKRPKKQVLKSAEALQKLTSSGQQLLHSVCRRAHRLVTSIQGTKAQDWLLQKDHATFVRYK